MLPTPVETAVRSLLTRFQELSRLPGTPELSYHAPVEGLLQACTRSWPTDVGHRIVVLHEPQRDRGVGAPDFLVLGAASIGGETEGCYAIVEVKPLNIAGNPDISAPAIADQLARYRALQVPVVVTDGITYLLIQAGQPDATELGDLVQKPLDPNVAWGSLPVDLTVLDRLRSCASVQGFRPVTRDQLFAEAANRAKKLRVDLEDKMVRFVPEAVRNREERVTMERLLQIKDALAEGHDSLLSAPSEFASFLAQTLTFGVLIAHGGVEVDGPDNPADMARALEKYWLAGSGDTHERLPIFAAVMNLLSASVEGDWMREAYGGMVRWASFLRVVPVRPESLQTYAESYEEFLKTFDPAARVNYGVYYTPSEAIDFAVMASESVARSIGAEQLLYSADSHIIDPCSGTGGFIERLAFSARRFEDWRASLPQTVALDHEPRGLRICGIEILPTPYALAQERAARLPQQRRCSVEIALANTLSDHLDAADCYPLPLSGDAVSDECRDLLLKERSRATRLAKRPITWIVGNPPCSHSLNHLSQRDSTRLEAMLDDFRPPQAERAGRSNVQSLVRNEWAKFLRWSCDRVLGSDLGLLSMYLPSTVARDESSKYIRSWLVRNFSEMWILEIDEDLRTRRHGSRSFFKGVQPGRLLLIALSRNEHVPHEACNVHFVTIVDMSRAEKIRSLEGGDLPAFLVSSPSAAPQAPDYRLDTALTRSAPPREGLVDSRCYWPLYRPASGYAGPAIFERICSGVKLAPSNLLVHVDPLMLQRRTRELARSDANLTDELRSWFADQARPPAIGHLTASVQVALQRAAAGMPATLRPYAYRPFVLMSLLYSTEILSALGDRPRSGTRSRPELIAAFADTSTRGIAVAPNSRAIGGEHSSLVAFCHWLPDNDMVARGSARIVCNRFPEYHTSSRDRVGDPPPRDNLSDGFKVALGGDAAPDSLQTLHYCYAVLSSHWYNDLVEPRTRGLGSLAVPLVPVLRDRRPFDLVSTWGEVLAKLENPQTGAEILPELEESVSSQRSAAGALLSSTKIDDDSGSYVLLQDASGNTFMRLGPIDPAILDETVGGYNVWETWLKFRTGPYLNRPFNLSDLRQLAQLASALQKRQEIIAEIDATLTTSAATDGLFLRAT